MNFYIFIFRNVAAKLPPYTETLFIMKKLYLVSHAKSDWTHDVEDFDRPLNDRGHGDARTMAKYLLEHGFPIQRFITSPARRALTTCRYFAETYGNTAIVKAEDLYEPHMEDFIETIMHLSDEDDAVALFSHNPAISQFATSLSSELLEFPTCAVAVFNIACDRWKSFEGAEKTLLNFLKPQDL